MKKPNVTHVILRKFPQVLCRVAENPKENGEPKPKPSNIQLLHESSSIKRKDSSFQIFHNNPSETHSKYGTELELP